MIDRIRRDALVAEAKARAAERYEVDAAYLRSIADDGRLVIEPHATGFCRASYISGGQEYALAGDQYGAVAMLAKGARKRRESVYRNGQCARCGAAAGTNLATGHAERDGDPCNWCNR